MSQPYLCLSETLGRALIVALAMRRTDEGFDDWETWRNTRYILTLNPQSGGFRIRHATTNARIVDIHDGSGWTKVYSVVPHDLARILAATDASIGSPWYLALLCYDSDAFAEVIAMLAPNATPAARLVAEHLDYLADQRREDRASVADAIGAALAHLDDAKRFGWADREADARQTLATITR